MTDKEILQGIDKLEDGIPFDEIRNGDKWLDIHGLFSEIRERINPWHYPSKGEYPKEDEDVVVLVKAGKKMLKGIGVYINQEWAIRHREEMWLIEPYAWQHIIPPKEEA